MKTNPPAAPLIIGIAGGSGSGKTVLAKKIIAQLGRRAVLVSQDWYYHDRSGLPPKEQLALNFDHPSSFDAALLRRHLVELKAGRPIRPPHYEYATHRRTEGDTTLKSSPVIVLEGLLILHNAPLRNLIDLSVFIDVPADIRLARRIRRDAVTRKIPVEETLRLYEHCVRPMHEKFIQPSARHADLVWRPLTEKTMPVRLKRQLEKICHE
ncbi:MAG: uridine kinase [Verrucomicrobiota bacterium]